MDWDIVKNSKECLSCGLSFKEKEEFFSALYEDMERFVRKDFCPNCWDSVDKGCIFSFWKSQMPERNTPQRPIINVKNILNIILRLESETDNMFKLNLRYVLALFLMRKKALKFRSNFIKDDKYFLSLYCPEDNREIIVYNPVLTVEETTKITDDVKKLLDDPHFTIE